MRSRRTTRTRARLAMEIHLESLLDNISATQHINPEFFDERR